VAQKIILEILKQLEMPQTIQIYCLA